MKTCLVLVTHNRVQYTRVCIQRVLSDRESDYDLYIWDNGSTDETPEYVKSLDDPRIKGIVLCKENLGQTAAMNRLWTATSCSLVAKLDNDCLVPSGWLKTFAEAHRDIEELGAVACWHFRIEDFNAKIAGTKIIRIKGHQIVRHPYVCGSGFMMKKDVFLRMGPWEEGSPDIGTTDYFMRMASRDYINGWYYPFVIQDHMDDPFSSHCSWKDDASLRQVQRWTYTPRVHKLDTVEKMLARRKLVLRNIIYGPMGVKYYGGWRRKLRRIMPQYFIWRRFCLRILRRTDH